MRRTLSHYRCVGTGYLQIVTSGIHDVFHAGLLRPYKENEVYGKNFTEPPPNLVEGEEVYEVETILNHRKRRRGYQYFVKWRWIGLRVIKRTVTGQSEMMMMNVTLQTVTI